MITVEEFSNAEVDSYEVGLETAGLTSFLEGIAPQLAVEASNARMMFNDDTRQLEVIEPAVIGRSLNIPESITSINEKLLAGEHEIGLVFDTLKPEVGDDSTAEQLGITELVSSHTSYFYGSSAARIQNITTAESKASSTIICYIVTDDIVLDKAVTIVEPGSLISS